MKKALNIGDPRKTIAIMLVGAIMGALLLGPIATFADDEDDDDNRREITTTIPNFMLLDRDGNALEFTLIENGVGKVLTLVEGPGPDYVNPFNNDDDD